MSELDDKELHDLVRKALQEYEPTPFSTDWEQMQQKLKHSSNRSIARWFWLLVLGGLVGGIWVFETSKPTKKVEHFTKKAVVTTQLSLKPTQPSGHVLGLLPKVKKKARLLLQEKLIPLAGETVAGQKSFSLTMSALQGRSYLLTRSYSLPAITPTSPDEALIKEQLRTGNFGADSTSYQVLARNNNRWSSAVLVCDFTSSMYPYSTQLIMWLKRNARNPMVKGMVFFTDCDSLGNETQEGHPGQMFVTHKRQIAELTPVLLAAARNTYRNQADAENDIEALLEAQRQFPEAKQLVLVADNSSGVKDVHRLNEIKKPVRVVVCGSTLDSTQAIHPDLWTIASQTYGSVHTIEDDISPQHLTHRQWIRIGARYYWYHARKQLFILSHFRQRPKRVLGLCWL
ncbi:MAG: hypothetical protein U0Y10_01575 [Spirosomataceae bacterium]